MPEPDSVDTDAQRAALEEMSQALLGRLNAMVAEQEKRAAEFAESTHSLSPLPQVAPLAQPPETPQAAPFVAPLEPQVGALPQVPQVPPLRKVAPPPGVGRHVAPPAAAEQGSPAGQKTPPAPLPVGLPSSSPKAAKNGRREEEKSSIGSGFVIFVLVVLYFLIRACSN